MTEKENSTQERTIIKKYANRRLYNTDTSTYVTLDDLAEMVREERDFVVFDAKTREDLTHSVLTQIIVEQESKGQNLLPVRFLRQLIKFYGDSFEQFVPGYLELSMESLAQQQDKFREQMTEAFGGTPFEAMQEQTRQNMAMFEQAMSMFTPVSPCNADVSATPQKATTKTPKKPKVDASKNEIEELKAQLSAVQSQLEKLADK